MISESLIKLVYAFGDAADAQGAAYENDICPRWERKQSTQDMVDARAALVTAIEAEVAAARCEKGTAVSPGCNHHDWYGTARSDGSSDVTCRKCGLRAVTAARS